MTRIALLAVVASLLAAPPMARARAAELTVTVTGLRNDLGVVTLCLWSQPAGFPDCNDRPVAKRASVPAHPGGVVIHFADVAPGIYAVSAFHDEKRLGRATTNFLEIPTVGVGASRDARGTLSAPSFKDAAFEVGTGPAQQTLRIDYP